MRIYLHRHSVHAAAFSVISIGLIGVCISLSKGYSDDLTVEFALFFLFGLIGAVFSEERYSIISKDSLTIKSRRLFRKDKIIEHYIIERNAKILLFKSPPRNYSPELFSISIQTSLKSLMICVVSSPTLAFRIVHMACHLWDLPFGMVDESKFGATESSGFEKYLREYKMTTNHEIARLTLPDAGTRTENNAHLNRNWSPTLSNFQLINHHGWDSSSPVLPPDMRTFRPPRLHIKPLGWLKGIAGLGVALLAMVLFATFCMHLLRSQITSWPIIILLVYSVLLLLVLYRFCVRVFVQLIKLYSRNEVIEVKADNVVEVSVQDYFSKRVIHIKAKDARDGLITFGDQSTTWLEGSRPIYQLIIFSCLPPIELGLGLTLDELVTLKANLDSEKI